MFKQSSVEKTLTCLFKRSYSDQLSFFAAVHINSFYSMPIGESMGKKAEHLITSPGVCDF